MPRSHDEMDAIYKRWCNIAPGHNESIEDYTARAVQFKIDFSDSSKNLDNEEFIRKWRQDFGVIVSPINVSIDDLHTTPPRWHNILPLYQLMATTKSYIKRNTIKYNKKDPKKENMGSEQVSTFKVAAVTTKLKYQEKMLPDCFKFLDAWKIYVRKFVTTRAY